MGMRLNQRGLFDEAGNVIASRTEEEIYTALGKKYKEPKMRGKR